MFERIKSFLLSIFHTYKVEEVTGVTTNISTEMYQAISTWWQMVTGTADWNEEAKPCGVLDQIAGDLSMTIGQEMHVTSKNKTIAEIMEHMNNNSDQIVQYIALLGGSVMRPVYSNGKLQYEIIPLGNYLPTRYDFDGTLTGAIIMKKIVNGKSQYLLTEQHTYENNTHNVQSKLYIIIDGALKEVPLTACQQTQNITPEYTWPNVRQPMIVEFRSHTVNKIDGSQVPCALIAGAVDLIADADKQYARMNWEQEAGEARLFADRDMFAKRQGRDGETVSTEMTGTLNRLITMIDGDGSTEGKKIVEHTPALRTDQQNAMLQVIFRRIEQTTNLGKGSISDLESVQQTATQFTGGKKAFYSIVDTIESELEAKYQQAANVLAYMAAAYKIGPNDPEITVSYNDMARKDPLQTKQMQLQEVSAGIMSKWEYRMKNYGEDEATAKANVPPADVAPSPFEM